MQCLNCITPLLTDITKRPCHQGPLCAIILRNPNTNYLRRSCKYDNTANISGDSNCKEGNFPKRNQTFYKRFSFIFLWHHHGPQFAVRHTPTGHPSWRPIAMSHLYYTWDVTPVLYIYISTLDDLRSLGLRVPVIPLTLMSRILAFSSRFDF